MRARWNGQGGDFSSPFTNLRSYSFANQAKQCGWGCSEIDVAATCIFQRKFVPYPYYIRTISPYLYDIRTISVRYPKRTSAVRPYGVRTASVRRLYGVFTESLRSLYGICTVSSRTSPVHPAYGMYGSLPSITQVLTSPTDLIRSNFSGHLYATRTSRLLRESGLSRLVLDIPGLWAACTKSSRFFSPGLREPLGYPWVMGSLHET